MNIKQIVVLGKVSKRTEGIWCSTSTELHGRPNTSRWKPKTCEFGRM